MFRFVLGLFVCLVISLMTSQAFSQGHAFTEDEPYLRELARERTNIGLLVGHRANGTASFRGTVTMLDGHNGLTSQHALRNEFISYSVRMPINRPDLTSDFNLFNNFGTFSVSNIINHPSYGGLSYGYDVSHLHFYDFIPGIETLHLYDGETNVGDIRRFTGGGQYGIINGDPPFTDGFLRGGFGRVHGFDFGFQYEGEQDFYRRYFFDHPSSPNYLPLSILSMPGFSGGEDLAWNSELERWELDGLLALGGPMQFESFFHSTPIPKNDIRANMWTGVPEPSSFVLLSLGTMLFALRRSR